MSVKVLVYDNLIDELELSEMVENGYEIISHAIGLEKDKFDDYYHIHYYTLVKKT